MTSEKKIFNKESISTAKVILAAMWQTRETGKERLMSHRYIESLCQNKHKNTYRSSISRLCSSKILKKGFNNILALTEVGERKALHAFIEVESALHRKGEAELHKWDGGWRIVFFDIPEKKRKHRDHLRKILKLVGFKEFQRSIWIYPYPVPVFLKDFMFDKNIKPHVRFITTNLVDDDRDLRAIFGLSPKS